MAVKRQPHDPPTERLDRHAAILERILFVMSEFAQGDMAKQGIREALEMLATDQAARLKP